MGKTLNRLMILEAAILVLSLLEMEADLIAFNGYLEKYGAGLLLLFIRVTDLA
jgi:hypothetical protein